MSYKVEEIITPFWAENKGFMTGRDALGVQNSSITVYGRLLPGMTNLTQRLRYYSLYCWLLKEYEKIDPIIVKKDFKHQYNFIRRAELIIAYLMVNEFPDDKSVIGSDYANKHIDDVNLNGYYEIDKGADKYPIQINPELYWDYKSGALGQYYGGSLINLGLIETIEGFFNIKETGRILAEAFEESVELDVRNYFLKCIEAGRLDKKDIKVIGTFNLNAIRIQSTEWVFLINMFLNNDGIDFATRDGQVTEKRKETIKLYLHYLKDKKTDIKFETWMYRQISNQTEANTSIFGWYYYYINEAIHYSLETIFWAFLENLDGRIEDFQTYINEIVDSIISENLINLKIKPSIKLKEIVNAIKVDDISNMLLELEKTTNSVSNWKVALGKAMELLMAIYVSTEKYKEKIKIFENLNLIDVQRGNVSDNLKYFISKNLDLSYIEHVNKVVRDLLNIHLYTAYRKMGDGEANLLKFIVEDNLVSHIQTMSPRHTTPRIHTLGNFLKDLNLVSIDYNLTPLGEKYLNILDKQ